MVIGRVNMSNQNTNIIVVGAGPAGAIAAHLLASQGYSVTLIGCANNSDYKAGETLPPNANELLKRLGLTPLLSQSFMF